MMPPDMAWGSTIGKLKKKQSFRILKQIKSALLN